MIQGINGWLFPAQGSQSGGSLFTETIVTLALGALALAGANASKKNNPGLASALYVVPVGLCLLWLFRRCCSGGLSGSPSPVHAAPLVVQPAQPGSSWWNWNWSQPPFYVAPTPAYVPSPVVQQHHPQSHAFVQRAPVVVPYSAPQVVSAPGGGFPAVRPAPAQPVGPATVGVGSFPAVRPAPAQPSGLPQISVAPIATASPSSHPGNQRVLFPVSATR